MSFWMQFVQPVDSLPAWYQPPSPNYPDTYDLGIQGLNEIVTAMSIMNLLDLETRAPQLPRWEEVGLTRDRGVDLWELWLHKPKPGQPTLDDELKPQERSAFAEYLTRFETATGQQSPSGLVLAYKFRTNDGWLVTPDECRVISEGVKDALANSRGSLIAELGQQGHPHTEESIEALLSPWANYNRVGIDHGGYRVW